LQTVELQFASIARREVTDARGGMISRWVSFDEDKRGTIEAGKFADLAVIDRAYLDIPAEDIHTLKSVLTMMAGKVVHASEPFGTLKDK